MVPSYTSGIDNSSEGKLWFDQAHAACIVPSVAATSVSHSSSANLENTEMSVDQLPLATHDLAMNSITDTLKILTDITNRDKLKAASDKASKDCSAIELIPDKFKNMTIRASATNDEAFPTNLCSTFIEILKQRKVVTMTMVINSMLQAANCQVEITPSLATAIWTCNFKPVSPLQALAFHGSVYPLSIGVRWGATTK